MAVKINVFGFSRAQCWELGVGLSFTRPAGRVASTVKAHQRPVPHWRFLWTWVNGLHVDMQTRSFLFSHVWISEVLAFRFCRFIARRLRCDMWNRPFQMLQAANAIVATFWLAHFLQVAQWTFFFPLTFPAHQFPISLQWSEKIVEPVPAQISVLKDESVLNWLNCLRHTEVSRRAVPMLYCHFWYSTILMFQILSDINPIQHASSDTYFLYLFCSVECLKKNCIM